MVLSREVRTLMSSSDDIHESHPPNAARASATDDGAYNTSTSKPLSTATYAPYLKAFTSRELDNGKIDA